MTTTFTADQYEESYPHGVERYFWNIARNAIIARSLKQSGMNGWPLLEIGCGRGIIVEHLRSRGVDCVGCELAAVPVPNHLREVVFNRTDFADLPAGQRCKFRGALLCDVIEHLPEPVAFLHKVREALPALEGLLVTVPARQELWSEWDRHSTDISGGTISLRFVQRLTRLDSSRCLPDTSSMAFTCPPSCFGAESPGRPLSSRRRYHGCMPSSARFSGLKK
jgi:hypothetical protein